MTRPFRRPLALALLMLTPLCHARAEEPLFLRIRPAGDTPAALGSAGSAVGPSDEETVLAARARSEAVWQRAEQRSRIAIASVCTGCIPAPRPAERLPILTPPIPAATQADGGTSLAAGPPAAPTSSLAQADAP